MLILNTVTGKILDSTRLINNHFISTGFIEDPPILLSIAINSGIGESVNAILFIGNEDLRISGSKEDFPDALTITGSEFQNYRTNLDKQIGPLNKMRDEKLQTMFSLRQNGKWNDSLQKAYWSKENGIIVEIDNQTKYQF